MMSRGFKILLVMAAVVALGAAAVPASSTEGAVRTYRVRITDLTGGQPFSPPVIVTHSASTGVFTVGERASFEIKEIAENGNNGPLLEALAADQGVSDFTEASAPLFPEGTPGNTELGFRDSVTLEITSAQWARFFSAATMLICTNDGFTGVDTVRLPTRVGESVRIHTAGYEARTEINTQDFDDLVPPCQLVTDPPPPEGGTGTSNPALAERGRIRHHRGIQAGVGDLDPEVHGWVDPVGLIVIRRTG
jgi:hypothetical protein